MATNTLYTDSMLNAFSGLITDLAAGGTDVKLALLASGYTFNQDAHESWDDVSASEISAGGGYTAGGESLTTKALTSATRVTTFDADDVTWSNSTITASYGVIYDDTPVADGDKKLLCLIDFEGAQSSEDGDFTVSFHADGIFTVTVSA